MRLASLLVPALLVACTPAAEPPEEPVEPDPVEEAPTAEPEPEPDPVEVPVPADSAWEERSEAPEPRTEVAAAPFGGQIWVAGGFAADGSASATVQIYDPTFDTWEIGPDLPEPVHHAAMVSTGAEILLVGGYVGAGFGQPTDAVRRLDAETGMWEDAPALPAPRAAGAAAWDGSRVVYGGGVGPDGLSGEVFVLAGGDWQSLGELSEPREHLGAASDGEGRVWFLAGRTAGLDTNLTAVDLVAGPEVRRIGDVPTARGGVTAFFHSVLGACAVGGEAPDRTFDEVECVDAGGEVVVLPPLSHPRHGLGAAVVDGFAYALLGGPELRLTVSATVESLHLGPLDG